MWGLGFRASGLRFRVWGLGFRVKSLGSEGVGFNLAPKRGFLSTKGPQLA